jgi:ABC-type uncharacterized transport system involved in gliding motility auxiliary subunit
MSDRFEPLKRMFAPLVTWCATLKRSTLAWTGLALAAVVLLSVNLASSIGLKTWSADLTQDKLFTISQGTREILKSIDEPIDLYLFFSDKASEGIPQLRSYFTTVREMLQEMAARSGGKLRLQVIDPLPFSEDEDRAASLGLQAVPVSASGDKVFLGIAGTNSTNGHASIPFLQPDKEAFLEYDVAKLIHDLSVTKKPAVGLIAGLPMSASFDPQTQQMRQPWAIYQQWTQLFDVKPVDAASLKAVDKDMDVLIVVQPKHLSDDAQYAIDQFVLRGGHLLVFVDPSAELDDSGADPSNPMAGMMADKSSDLP